MPGQITAFDIGECMVKAVCFTGGKLKKVMAKELPDNMVSGGEIVSMDAMADFIKEMAKENGISRGAAAVILPGTLVFTRNVTVPAMTDGQLLYNLPFEFKDYLTQEKNKYYFDYAVQDTVKDEEGNVKELQLFVCATLKSTVEEYRAMLRRAGFNLKVAMPEECAYAALTEDYMQRTNAPAGSDYCFVDLGHNGIRMHILQDGNFTTKRSGDLGLRDLEQTISDVRGGCGGHDPVQQPQPRASGAILPRSGDHLRGPCGQAVRKGLSPGHGALRRHPAGDGHAGRQTADGYAGCQPGWRAAADGGAAGRAARRVE